MAIENDVQAMIQAGVPEQEIANFIKQETAPKEKKGFVQQTVEALDSRPTFEMVGSAIGAGLGGLGGSAVPVLGTAGGAVAGGGLGAGAGGQLYDLMHGEAGSLLDQSKKAASDIAIETGMGIVAPKALQLGADAVQSALKPMSKSLLGKATGLNKVVGGNTVDDLAAMERVGMKPDASLLDNSTNQQLGQSLRTKIGSSKIMQETDRFNYGKISDLFEDTAASFGKSTTKQEAGEALKKEAKQKKSQFFKIADDLYTQAYKSLPDEIPVPKLQKFVDEKMLEMDATGTSKLLNKEAINLLGIIKEDIADGVVNKNTINSFKKLAKDAFAKHPSVRTDSDRAMIEMRKIYGEDIDNAALATGDMEASAALEKANNWWKKGVGNAKKGKPGYLDHWNKIEQSEESADAFKYATQKIKGGDKRLKQILKANPEAKGEIQAQVFRDLGEAGTEGNFSYNKFLTNFSKLPKETKKVLFGSAGQEFDDLVRVSQMAKSLEKKANFSNTENMRYFNQLFDPIKKAMFYGGLGGGAGAGLSGAMSGAAIGAGVIGTGAIANTAMAKLYTNPKFVRWLADTGQRVLIKPENLSPQIARLGLMATRWPKEEMEQAQEYISSLGYGTKTTKDKKGKTKMEVLK